MEVRKNGYEVIGGALRLGWVNLVRRGGGLVRPNVEVNRPGTVGRDLG